MSYTPSMRESINKVNATRAARMKETFPALAVEERNRLMDKFHPDYVAEAMRQLHIGPNKGDRTPRELADLLEGRSIVNPENVDLGHVDHQCDVLVIGGGGAGASAALLAQENGAQVILATKLRLGDANTIMAQGGIQAADKPGDSPAIHYLDAMGGGDFANDPDLVETLVKDAPSVVAWLENLGCMFDKEADGTMCTIHGGGTSRKRMHYARDYTGKEIMITLRDEVRNRRITVLEFCPALELIMDNRGHVAGAVLQHLETGQLMVVVAKTTVLATGGAGRLHFQGFPTTNHYGATADGLVLAYRVGAKLAFIDTMQYHPTGAAYPEQILGLLVTEKVRGLGAQILNAQGEQFVHHLETRDAESVAIIRECVERKKGITTPTGQHGVWLDSPMIDLLHGEGTTASQLPAMVRQFKRFDIDMTREPILVYPTLHYQNGGIMINPDGQTKIPNLYAAGEVSGGVHGRNRLMGNSLLDVTVFGRRAGRSAALRAKEVQLGQLTLEHVQKWNRELEESGLGEKVTSPLLLPDYARRKQ